MPGNQGAAGAKIRIYDTGTKRLLWSEQVAIYNSQAATGCYGRAQTERHYGLGTTETVDISVAFYPSGRQVWRRGAHANQAFLVREKTGHKQRLPRELDPWISYGGAARPLGLRPDKAGKSERAPGVSCSYGISLAIRTPRATGGSSSRKEKLGAGGTGGYSLASESACRDDSSSRWFEQPSRYMRIQRTIPTTRRMKPRKFKKNSIATSAGSRPFQRPAPTLGIGP